MYCSNCGKQYEGSFCPECGTSSQEVQLKNDNMEKKVFMSANSENEPSIYKLSAGRIASNGERNLVTQFQVRGDQITTTSYKRTSENKPFSSYTFYKKNVKRVFFTVKHTTEGKIGIAAFCLAIFLSCFFFPYWIIKGPLCIFLIIIYRYLEKNTMIITLDSGVKIRAYYTKWTETTDIYRILTSADE